MLDPASPFAAAQPPGAETKNVVALRRLRQAIVGCEIRPGAEISEGTLAERFRIGRAAVRVALVTLAHEGFVTPLARQGWRMSPITGAMIGDIVAARRRLEPALAQVVLSQKDIGHLDAAIHLNAALSGRDDAPSLVTARITDRQIMERLAGQANAFIRRWLAESWDHCERVVHFLDASDLRFRPVDRAPLVAALARNSDEEARMELVRAVTAFENFAAHSLLRLPVELAGGHEISVSGDLHRAPNVGRPDRKRRNSVRGESSHGT